MKATDTKCKNNLKQIGTHHQFYISDFKEYQIPARLKYPMPGIAEPYWHTYLSATYLLKSTDSTVIFQNLKNGSYACPQWLQEQPTLIGSSLDSKPGYGQNRNFSTYALQMPVTWDNVVYTPTKISRIKSPARCNLTADVPNNWQYNDEVNSEIDFFRHKMSNFLYVDGHVRGVVRGGLEPLKKIYQ